MLLDKTEIYQLNVKKWRIVFHLLFISFFYYRIPAILYKKWALNPLSGWVIFYSLLSIIAIGSIFRLIIILFQDGFVLKMTGRGLETKAFGFINWTLIRELKVNKSGINNTTLLIFLHEPETFISTLNLSKFKRKIMAQFEKDEGTPFFISISETDYKAEAFNSALLKFKNTPSV